jgi:hypothetical protein
MSEAKFTPGPWKISATGDHIFGREQGEPNGPTYVCTVSHNSSERLAPERNANARLIAAAPELGSYLKREYDAWQELHSAPSKPCRCAKCGELFDLLQKAGLL